MKKNYVKYTAVFLLGLGAFSSCKKSFLETTPKGEFAETNYYQTPAEAFAGLVAAYGPLTTETGGLDGTYTDPLGPLNAASDDCVSGGGGSSDTPDLQAANNYTELTSTQGPQAGFWPINFLGISSANIILSKLGSVPGLSTALKNQYTGEALFLRAYYYFNLVRLFGNVPLITQPLVPADIYNQPQVKAATTYAQIEADLTAAIPNLPVTIPASEDGRVTQGAAVALLGKVYLYEKKWTQAAAELALVNGTTPGQASATYGYKLLTNFASIFDPNNKFNSESIWELARTASGNYTWNNWDQFKSNIYVQFVGPRNYAGPVYSGGYGFNPITLGLVAAYKTPYYGGTTKDPRYGYTMYDMDSLVLAQNSSYQASYENTGYFIQKYAPLTKFLSPTGTNILNFPNDYIEIRLADTYLMEAEALVNAGTNTARAQALMDAVRARVGLASVPVTLTNLKAERRLELATEGHRWYDLVRWGDAPTALASKGFTAGKNEVFPIPLSELSNTKLVQNPGY